MNALLSVLVATMLVAWIFGVVSYLQMMRTIPREVARFHMKRLRVRSNMLCFSAPELFIGAGAAWRRCYLSSMAAFCAAMAVAAVSGALGGA